MKRLLVVVDYQNDFVDGALGFPGAEALDGPIAEKVAAYRAAGDMIAYNNLLKDFSSFVRKCFNKSSFTS